MKRAMMALGALITSVTLAAPLLTATAASMASGMQVGERTPPFDVVDVTGPNKGKELCYVWAYSGAPTVMAFVKATEVPKATGLVAHMQKLVKQNSGLQAFVVVVGGPETKPAIEALAKRGKLTIPVTFMPKGKEDPSLAKYKVNLDAKNTVTISRGNRVRENWVNVEKKQYSAITDAAKKVLAEG